MSDEEAWTFLEAGHTAILTTLRRDGWPVSLPLWYVVDERVVYVTTPASSQKVARIRNDDRACLLVERGDEWAELAAVQFAMRATVLVPGPEADRASGRFAAKYEAFRPPRGRAPDVTKRRYSSRVVIRLDPAGPPISWDNARIRLKG